MNTDKIRVIGKNIEDSLKKYGINIRVQYLNNNKVIALQDNDRIYLWLRLYTNGDKFNADISTIELAEDLRRRGIFNTLCYRLYKCKYIDRLRITGVCSPEMQGWCFKHKLKEENPMDYLVKF